MDMKLKSCPFCGGDARLFVNDGVEVQCTKCGIHTETLIDMPSRCGSKGSHAIEMVIEKMEQQSVIPTDTCVTCENFIGGGDWGLCCKIKYDLCYECTPKCKDYQQKEVRKNNGR